MATITTASFLALTAGACWGANRKPASESGSPKPAQPFLVLDPKIERHKIPVPVSDPLYFELTQYKKTLRLELHSQAGGKAGSKAGDTSGRPSLSFHRPFLIQLTGQVPVTLTPGVITEKEWLHAKDRLGVHVQGGRPGKYSLIEGSAFFTYCYPGQKACKTQHQKFDFLFEN